MLKLHEQLMIVFRHEGRLNWMDSRNTVQRQFKTLVRYDKGGVVTRYFVIYLLRDNRKRWLLASMLSHI